MNKSQELDYFFRLSVHLTGFNLVELFGTGQGTTYFSKINEILGEDFIHELLSRFESLEVMLTDDTIESRIETYLLRNDKWGPVCRNIIRMWYMGNWYQLEELWRTNYIFSKADITQVISTNSYIEGLVWASMGRHPKGAKQPGYGTWATPPDQ